jgi:uncharacterized Zn finger protein
MPIPIFRPYVFLRCKKCSRKTEHVLTIAANVKNGRIEETYECQECGETKVIYELTTVSQLADHVEV